MEVIIFGSGGLSKELMGYLPPEYRVLYIVSTEPHPWIEVREKAEHDAAYLLAVADPALKKKIVSENEDRWISFIHPTCFVSRHAKLGRGCILAPQASVCGDPEIGNFVFMNTNATVGHDTFIGDYTTLFPNSEVCGDCDVEEGCLLGIGAYVLPKVRLHPGTKVSAGAIVRKTPEDSRTLYGDPAQPRVA